MPVFRNPSAEINEELVQAWAKETVFGVAAKQQPLREQRTAAVFSRLEKVLEAFSKESLGAQENHSPVQFLQCFQGKALQE